MVTTHPCCPLWDFSYQREEGRGLDCHNRGGVGGYVTSYSPLLFEAQTSTRSDPGTSLPPGRSRLHWGSTLGLMWQPCGCIPCLGLCNRVCQPHGSKGCFCVSEGWQGKAIMLCLCGLAHYFLLPPNHTWLERGPRLGTRTKVWPHLHSNAIPANPLQVLSLALFPYYIKSIKTADLLISIRPESINC